MPEHITQSNEKLFKVSFNWHGELHTFYSHAKSKNQAYFNAVSRLAKKLGRPIGVVDRHYQEYGQYMIEEEN